jgi:4-hydroxy-tetrahydrodipicolinate synthase
VLRPEGSWVAIPTPFTEEDKVDFEGFEELVDFQAENGTDGILLMGSTGESPALTIDERREILDKVLAYARGKIPVFAGTTCGNTQQTIELTQYAQQAGADGALLVVPPYLKPSQDGLYEHFKAVAEAVDVPIAIYNNPGRVGVNIDPGTVIQLAEIPNIVADKEAMPNIGQLVQIRREAGDKLNLLCCDAPGFSLIVPTLALGGHGTANISGNIIPQEMAEISRPWRSWEDVERTRELLFTYFPLMAGLYSLTNPVVVKAALRLLGLPAGHVRRPLLDMSESGTQLLQQVLDELGVTDKYGLTEVKA